jgi:hypothetical protein
MLDVVRLLSQVPGIFLRRSISLPETLIFYAAVFLVLLAINKRHALAQTDILPDVKTLKEA